MMVRHVRRTGPWGWWPALLVAVLIVTASPSTAGADVPPGLTRLDGPDRVATAVDVSEAVFPGGGGGYVLATADGFADALAGSVLAAQVGGPVLLTPPDALPADVLAELTRVGPGPAFVVGGTTAVTDGVASLLSAERVAGDDRYETAAAIAARAVGLGAAADTVYVTTGRNFADAVSVAGLAAGEGAPILLADAGRTNAAAGFVAGADVTRVVAVGGEAALPGDVLAQVAGDVPTDRLSGGDRYATSHAVADAAVAAGASAASVWLATGETYPDALAAGPAVAAAGGVLHLAASSTIDTDPDDDADVRGLLVAGCPVERVVLVGGDVALETDVEMQAEAAGITCDDTGTGALDVPDCDPSYPGLCIPPPPPDLNCDDVDASDFRVIGDDPHGFDADGNGIGCES